MVFLGRGWSRRAISSRWRLLFVEKYVAKKRLEALSELSECAERRRKYCKRPNGDLEGVAMPLGNAYHYAYCLFCMSGQEKRVAELINKKAENIYACAIERERYVKHKGKREIVRDIMFPGYVLVYAAQRIEFWKQYYSGVYGFLKNIDGHTELMGNDLVFAERILENHGVLRISKAYREGTQVHIIEGPLLGCGGVITRMDVRSRCAQVLLNFAGRETKCWLSFDIITDRS